MSKKKPVKKKEEPFHKWKPWKSETGLKGKECTVCGLKGRHAILRRTRILCDKPTTKKPVALIIAGPVRHLPPPQKVWDRGAVFAKHELDTIEGLAKYLLRVRKHLDGVSIQAARDVLKILSTKKI